MADARKRAAVAIGVYRYKISRIAVSATRSLANDYGSDLVFRQANVQEENLSEECPQLLIYEEDSVPSTGGRGRGLENFWWR